MKISISRATDLAFADMRDVVKGVGFGIFKNTLPKGVNHGAVVKASDITFGDNQQAIVFLLVYAKDVLSGGNYEQAPILDSLAETIAAQYDTLHPVGSPYRYELLGQTIEKGDDATSHFVSNRYLLTFNTD